MALSNSTRPAGDEGQMEDDGGSGDQFSSTHLNIVVTLVCLTGLLMLVGYLWVVVTVVRTRTLHTASNCFLASLAVAEIVLAICGLPGAVIVASRPAFSFALVLFLSWSLSFSAIGYFLNAVLVAVDKWFKISRPFLYVRAVTRTKSVICLAVVWGLSTVGSLGTAGSLGAAVAHSSNDTLLKSFSLLAVILSIVVILPCVTVILVLNILIVRIARHQARAIAEDLPAAPRPPNPGDGERAPGEPQAQAPGNQAGILGAVHRKSTRQFSIFFLSFVLAWTPVVIAMPVVHYTSATEDNAVIVILLIGAILILFQAAFGTLILTLLQREYRQLLKGNLQALWEKLHLFTRR